MTLTLMTLSTKARSVTSPLQGRSCNSQTANNNNDVNKNEADGGQEPAKADVDLYEQQEELWEHDDEDDELAEARDEDRDDQHEDVDTVIVLGWHRAMSVPRANGEARQVPLRDGEQRDDGVAGPPDGSH